MSRSATRAIAKFSQVKQRVDLRLSQLGEDQKESKQRLQRLSENLRLIIIANKAVVQGDVYSKVQLCALTTVIALEIREMADEFGDQ